VADQCSSAAGRMDRPPGALTTAGALSVCKPGPSTTKTSSQHDQNQTRKRGMLGAEILNVSLILPRPVALLLPGSRQPDCFISIRRKSTEASRSQ